MKYAKVKDLPAHLFYRNTGVKRKTFALMVATIREVDRIRLKGEGRHPKLGVEDQILMTLEYLREYRTYFHLGVDYEVGESSCFRIVRRIEDALIASKVFALPKRSAALHDLSIEKVTLDCTESPVERPQKNSADTTRERRNATPSKRR